MILHIEAVDILVVVARNQHLAAVIVLQTCHMGGRRAQFLRAKVGEGGIDLARVV